MITRRTALMGAALAAAAAPAVLTRKAAAEESITPQGKPIDLSSMPRRKVKLVPPPFVHEHEQVATTPPSIVEFEMMIVEKEIEIDGDGTMMQAMTFDGSIPGPMMVVHEGDYVELMLVNPAENAIEVA